MKYALLVGALALGFTIVTVSALTRTAATRPTPTYPAGARTGVARVDRYLAALQAKDVAGLVALVQYTKLPCVRKKEPGYTFIKCKPGEPTGTLVDTFWLGTCDAGSTRADDVAMMEIVGRFIDGGRKLYAVYRSNGRSITPRGGYGIIFAHPADGEAYASTLVLSKRGGLIGIAFAHCADSPAEVWAYSKGAVVLAPRRR